jgi:hypothetical protein
MNASCEASWQGLITEDAQRSIENKVLVKAKRANESDRRFAGYKTHFVHSLFTPLYVTKR